MHINIYTQTQNHEKAHSFWAPKEQRFPAVVKGREMLAALKLLITFK